MSKGFRRSIFGFSVVLVLVIFLGGLGLRGVRANTQGDDGSRVSMRTQATSRLLNMRSINSIRRVWASRRP
jgi:hypothetical protein